MADDLILIRPSKLLEKEILMYKQEHFGYVDTDEKFLSVPIDKIDKVKYNRNTISDIIKTLEKWKFNLLS